MYGRRLTGLLLSAVCFIPFSSAQEQGSPAIEITYQKALALAREQAPVLAAEKARIGEAERRVDAASVWPFNPELSAAAGPRDEPSGTVVDWSVGLEQRIELGGQRALRRNAARAGVAAASDRTANAQRRLVREVSLAFVSALYWERRVLLAEDNTRLAEGIARIATQRHELGDVGGLDQSVSELAVLQAQGQADRNRAALALAEGRIKGLLGIEARAEIACRGDLGRIGIPDQAPAELIDRPDLRALQAEIQQAEAEVALARAKRMPDLAVGAIFSREESVDIVKGAVTFALPIFQRGQGEAAVAAARRERLRLEYDSAASTASAQVSSAREVARRLSAAALRFEQRGPGLLEESERLATGSYEAGAIPLGELLALRRELVQVRRDHVDLLYRAATAQIEWASSAGTLR